MGHGYGDGISSSPTRQGARCQIPDDGEEMAHAVCVFGECGRCARDGGRNAEAFEKFEKDEEG